MAGPGEHGVARGGDGATRTTARTLPARHDCTDHPGAADRKWYDIPFRGTVATHTRASTGKHTPALAFTRLRCARTISWFDTCMKWANASVLVVTGSASDDARRAVEAMHAAQNMHFVLPLCAALLQRPAWRIVSALIAPLSHRANLESLRSLHVVCLTTAAAAVTDECAGELAHGERAGTPDVREPAARSVCYSIQRMRRQWPWHACARWGWIDAGLGGAIVWRCSVRGGEAQRLVIGRTVGCAGTRW